MPRSYMPMTAAAAHPTAMPHNGAQRRSVSEPRRVIPTMMARVARAATGADQGEDTGASSRRPSATEARESAISIITVPYTVGVMIRLMLNSHLEKMIWNAAETSTRVVIVVGPPSTSAMMQNGMAAKDVYTGKTAPVPMGPSRTTCSNVDTPITTSVANTSHSRKASLPPDPLTTITGPTSVSMEATTVNCKPTPAATRAGGLSWGS